MKVALFDFELPRELIASHQVRPRDAARLLVVSDLLLDRRIRDLADFLRAGDILVFNDTKVIPARLFGRTADTDGKIELLLHRDLGEGRWFVLAKPARKLTPGRVVIFGDGLHATVVGRLADGQVEVAFNRTGTKLHSTLARIGLMPLPPYIKRSEQGDPHDRRDYQTIFAKRRGAVAAPTAGLHFTRRLLERLDAAGVERVGVTLHVGAGTFRPVKVEDTRDHAMHAEWCELSERSARAINAARGAGRRVIAVGSTSLRTIEAAARDDGLLAPFSGETSLFITPGYRFKVVDILLTNFHLPRSTLFMLVAAFAGLERMQAAYAQAVHEHYRFFSYGDACLIERQDHVVAH
ncbi:MAG: tRNA preQ1(34) S-adenosylmethionine ribosyltransferase-isomerase QueA [Alphaproteobacteria bacterium]|nr:tRNA preQ1(34) S-adenosylmethionine ribosyltransferase-isomerase QueA [Alphaproteobacteria bacterium]